MLRVMILIAAILAGGSLRAEPLQWQGEWPETNFKNSLVLDWSEIRSGGPPKDGIPALDMPTFVAVSQGQEIGPREPVIAVEIKGQVPRAYPLRYLIWHEIINDQIGALPIAVTYCPLCNSAMSFDRRVAGWTLSFGVTGKLRHSDMVMYDRETQSWWQQAIGQAIVGRLAGAELTPLPSWMESWQSFSKRNPHGLVMAEPDYPRAYERNPYRGYDSSAWPFLYSGEPPPHGIEPLARVLRIGARAWPLSRLAKAGELREAGIVIRWSSGQASALDTASLSRGRDVGTIRVSDTAGQDLPHDLLFAFAFHAFWPQGKWMLGQD
ncbi:DUF3179 domain-containing protein [Pseudophaeobacter sp.]|uniref:DUF3179 domain-containing protein n=1 Tax=Pseudophaeobacter sp. TaxID=1971739 RepID=UPI004057DC85